MKRTEQYQLFALGVRGARAFLEQLQWEPYKELRARKAQFRNFVEGKGGLQNPSEDPDTAPGPVAGASPSAKRPAPSAPAPGAS